MGWAGSAQEAGPRGKGKGDTAERGGVPAQEVGPGEGVCVLDTGVGGGKPRGGRGSADRPWGLGAGVCAWDASQARRKPPRPAGSVGPGQGLPQGPQGWGGGMRWGGRGVYPG